MSEIERSLSDVADDFVAARRESRAPEQAAKAHPPGPSYAPTTMSTQPATTQPAQPGAGQVPPHHNQMQRVVPTNAVAAQAHRELYWQNVIREMLSALAVAAAESGGRLGSGAADKATGSAPIDDMFDGRLAVVTRLGQRIAIADVVPLFACSVPGQKASSNDRHLSMDVQCTIFQIHTPTARSTPSRSTRSSRSTR